MKLSQAPAGVPLKILRYNPPPRLDPADTWPRPARVISLVEDWENWDQHLYPGDRIMVVNAEEGLVEVTTPITRQKRVGILVTYSDCVRAGGDHLELTEVELCGSQWN